MDEKEPWTTKNHGPQESPTFTTSTMSPKTYLRLLDVVVLRRFVLDSRLRRMTSTMKVSLTAACTCGNARMSSAIGRCLTFGLISVRIKWHSSALLRTHFDGSGALPSRNFCHLKNSQKSTPKSPNKFKSIHQSIHRTKVFGHPKKKKKKKKTFTYMSPEVGGFLPALNSHTIIPKENKSNCLVLIELDSSSGAMYLKINRSRVNQGRGQINRIHQINRFEKRSVVLLFTQSNIQKNTRSYTFTVKVIRACIFRVW